MKIKFLGTGHGAPDAKRNYQSILIECKEAACLIDAGAPVLHVLSKENYDFSKIKAVFISHLHSDHMTGLLDMLNLAEYFSMKFDVYLPEERGINAFKCFSHMQSSKDIGDRVNFRLIGENMAFDDGNIKINPFLTKHSSVSYGFMIECSGKKLCITSDLSCDLGDFPDLLFSQHTDMIITECAHFTACELAERLKKCNTKKIAVIHINEVAKYAELRKISKTLGSELILPDDGDEVFSQQL